MRAALFQPESNRHHVPLRERVTASGLAIAIEILIALALLYALAPRREPPEQVKVESRTKEFSLTDTKSPDSTNKTAAHKATHQKSAQSAAPQPVTVTPIVTKNTTAAPKSFTLAGLIPMDLEKADISKIHHDTGAPTATAETNDTDDTTARGVGTAPGGETMYAADWYREPTDAQIDGYLPPQGAPEGSEAVIACQMLADYHVENCQSVSESPVGSGLARAMRQAAWQFLVRPPRIGDRKLVGTWVRITITFDRFRRER